MKQSMWLRCALVLCPLLVPLLSCLPGGVELEFLAENQEENVALRYPVFSVMAVAYGHMALALAGVFSGGLGLLELLALGNKGRRRRRVERNLLPLAAFTLLLSGFHLLFGVFSSVTWIMAGIWLLLILETLAAWRIRRVGE